MAYKLPRLNHLLVHAMLCADDPRRRNEGGSALNGLCRSLHKNQREVGELTGCRIQPRVDLPVSRLRLVRWRNIERLCAELHKVSALRMIHVVTKIWRAEFLKLTGSCPVSAWQHDTITKIIAKINFIFNFWLECYANLNHNKTLRLDLLA